MKLFYLYWGERSREYIDALTLVVGNQEGQTA